jgi:hypothetical protein
METPSTPEERSHLAAQDPKFPNVAIFWVPEAYALSPKLIMGRQSAGAGFLRAIAAAKPQRLFCYARSREEAEAFKRAVQESGGSRTEISWIPLLRPKGLRQAGLLYRPDANIASDAWRRAAQGDDRAYSICGVTHTTATHAIMEGITSLVTAPLHSWDALVCTSHAVRDSVRSVIEAVGEHLKERLAATRITLPQLPLIPLGVDCGAYQFSEDARAQARQVLGIEADEVAVCYGPGLAVAAASIAPGRPDPRAVAQLAPPPLPCRLSHFSQTTSSTLRCSMTPFRSLAAMKRSRANGQ